MRPLGLVLLLTVVPLLTPGCASAKRKSQSNAHLELGAAYLEERNPEGAITELREAVHLNRRNAAAWEKLGLAYMSRGASDEALRAFQRALRYDPDNAQILNNYGLLLLSREQTDDAIAAFEHALEDLTYRKPALVLNNLGYAYFLAGRNDEALRRLDEAVNRSPNLCQARFHRGLVWKAKGELENALTDLDRVIQQCGDEAPGAYYHAAEVLLAQGNRVAAETYIQNVLRLVPDDPKLRDAARALLAEAED